MALTPYPLLRLKLTQPPALKMRFLPAIPGANLNGKVDRTGDTMTGSLILAFDPSAALEAVTKQYVDSHSGVSEVAVNLTDQSPVTLDASLGNVFQLNASANRTILAPTNAPAVNRTQKIVIRHMAIGGSARTLTLTTGSSGAFRFGTTITALTATTSTLTDYIGCIWNQSEDRWDVVAYAKGF